MRPELLVQPPGRGFTIFHEVYDWNDGRDYRSPETYKVPSGDVLTQSVTYRAEDNSYDMYTASAATGQSITWNYQLQASQGSVPETRAFLVVEHSPRSCDMYPSSGFVTFAKLYVEVDGEEVVDPAWVAAQENPACDSVATVVNSSTVTISWNPEA